MPETSPILPRLSFDTTPTPLEQRLQATFGNFQIGYERRTYNDTLSAVESAERLARIYPYSLFFTSLYDVFQVEDAVLGGEQPDITEALMLATAECVAQSAAERGLPLGNLTRSQAASLVDDMRAAFPLVETGGALKYGVDRLTHEQAMFRYGCIPLIQTRWEPLGKRLIEYCLFPAEREENDFRPIECVRLCFRGEDGEPHVNGSMVHGRMHDPWDDYALDPEREMPSFDSTSTYEPHYMGVDITGGVPAGIEVAEADRSLAEAAARIGYGERPFDLDLFCSAAMYFLEGGLRNIGPPETKLIDT
jgi:hypothetical protein